MKKVYLLGIFITLVSTLKAQYQVELLELDETTAIFRVEASSEKKKEILDNAKQNVFRKLFYEGVEDFNGGNKIIETENKYWLTNFFKGSDAPYNGFVKGAQLEAEPSKLVTGQFHGFVNVVVNYSLLMRTLEINQLINRDESKDTLSIQKPKRKFGINARKKENSDN